MLFYKGVSLDRCLLSPDRGLVTLSMLLAHCILARCSHVFSCCFPVLLMVLLAVRALKSLPAYTHAFGLCRYLTPPHSHGFTTHTDNKDGLIVQVAGRKRWVVWEPRTLRRPLRSQMRGRPHEPPVEKGQMVFNGTLHAGDVLHVPRGWIHQAEAVTDEPSLHYTSKGSYGRHHCAQPIVAIAPWSLSPHQQMPDRVCTRQRS